MSIRGLAGFFFLCPDPDSIREWYARHLGVGFSVDGVAWFRWTDPESGRAANTAFGPVDQGTTPFDPGTQPFMVRYRVSDLEALAAKMRAADESRLSPTEDRAEGRFAWAVDPDGQKLELREVGGAPPQDLGETGADCAAGTPPELAVTGIGGVFFRSANVAEVKNWYAAIGVCPGPDGYVVFPAGLADGVTSFTAWEIFHHDTTYFDSDGEPNPHPYMINFRVPELHPLLDRLRGDGVWVDPNTEEYEYGKFGWVVDPLGARVELWEPTPG